jgi:hypothetical protein
MNITIDVTDNTSSHEENGKKKDFKEVKKEKPVTRENYRLETSQADVASVMHGYEWHAHYHENLLFFSTLQIKLYILRSHS